VSKAAGILTASGSYHLEGAAGLAAIAVFRFIKLDGRKLPFKVPA
jgi:hypothetical protein